MQPVPAAGEVIASRFTIEAEIGRGGMGVVFRGRDENGLAVAIKVLLPEAVEHPEAVPRFVNEARAARELTSEHSVRVLDAGTLPNGLPYMVMELLEGEDLATRLEREGTLSVADACDAVIDASDALAEAHSRGMVHRDLKPANLFAARSDGGRTRVKVLDFGVSKVAAQMRQAALTSTGTALGTPHYMAPEQLKSAKGADARADIWSLGVVLYELLSGQMPFDGRSFGMLFMQIVSEEPKPLGSVKPELPPGLCEVVHRCMKKNRDDRYRDLAELVSELANFASPSGAAAAQRIAAGRQPPRAPAESLPSIGKLGGTMLMANAPPIPASARMAAAPAAAPPQSGPHPAAPISHPAAVPPSAPQAERAPAPPTFPQPSPAELAHPRPAASGRMVAILVAVFVTLVVVGAGLAYVALRTH